MDPVALDPCLAPAPAHLSGSADAALSPACVVIPIAAALSAAAVARRDATSTAGAAPAAALAHARPSAAGRKTAWGRGDVHRATSAVAMAGGAQIRGATLFAPAVHARDPCRVLALGRVLVLVLIHPTRGIAGAGPAPGRIAGGEKV